MRAVFCALVGSDEQTTFHSPCGNSLGAVDLPVRGIDEAKKRMHSFIYVVYKMECFVLAAVIQVNGLSRCTRKGDTGSGSDKSGFEQVQGCYSGVEFNLTGPLRDDGWDEESGMSRVFTPIFFSDDSSVTEMERVKDGRIEGAESKK